MTVTGSGIFDVPYPAAAVMVGVVPVPSASTPEDYLTIYPSSPRPNTSSVNFSGGRLVPNGVIMNLAAAPSNGPETSQVYNAAGIRGRRDGSARLFLEVAGGSVTSPP